MRPTSTPRFSWADPEAKAFFDDNGFAILRDVLHEADRDALRSGWSSVVEQAAASVELAPAEFMERFSQNRDLWRKHPHLEYLIKETAQWQVAARCLGVSGVRLFHDHAIIKPAARSGAIPWHQDSAYWPLDRVGISLWTPLDAVPLEGGCLRVLAGSHKDGPSAPQDFLVGEGASRDDDERALYLPVERGETVALHGLVWHSSGPNRAQRDRLAYLSLWVPATARFVQSHATWHPAAAHIAVGSGERLDGDWFPLFGELTVEDEGQHVSFPSPPEATGPTMFTAGKDIARHVAWLVGDVASNLETLLARHGVERVVAVAAASGVLSPGDEVDLSETLRELALQERVRKASVARDIYLRAAARWWQLVGSRIEEAQDAS
jgi:ectoine hydroxylase-related dioxygenase (phytanoyl-CoA dioxygenase family)